MYSLFQMFVLIIFNGLFVCIGFVYNNVAILKNISGIAIINERKRLILDLLQITVQSNYNNVQGWSCITDLIL